MAFGIRLSRRERQIMEILFRKGQASSGEVLEAMPDAPGYSSVRTHLRILEEKGHVTHTTLGTKYVFQPVTPARNAARSALSQVMETFFGGSVEQVVATLVSDSETKLSSEQLERLAELIEFARVKENENYE